MTLPHETRLKNRRGNGCEFLLRRCDEKDLPAIVSIQDKVIAGLNESHIFERTSDEQIEESLREDFCLGAFCEGKLAAAAIMVVNRVTPRNLGVHLGYDEARLHRCATCDSVFVLPQFRGYGLQSLFCQLWDEAALELGCTEELATVSPDNFASLRNLRAIGFEILDEKVMYTGVRRYLMGKMLLRNASQYSHCR